MILHGGGKGKLYVLLSHRYSVWEVEVGDLLCLGASLISLENCSSSLVPFINSCSVSVVRTICDEYISEANSRHFSS